MRKGTIACVLWGVCACSVEPEWSTATLSLRELQSCRLPRLEQITVRAAGDFASEQRSFAAGARATLDDFPTATRWLTVEAIFEGGRAGGLVPVVEGARDSARDVLLLPLETSCPLGDPLLRARPGAAIAALPTGELLIVGGQSGTEPSSSNAVLLRGGSTLVEQVPEGTLLRRAGASATAVGSQVLVAGGAADNVFEVYDSALGRFVPELSGRLALASRREHGAVSLGEGRVLLAGGLGETEGDPLESVEIVDVAARSARELDGGLAVARVSPELLALDDGTVLALLGLGASGEAVLEVERFDPSEGFEVVASLPSHESQAVAALEGQRVAYLGCDPGAACELWLLLPEAGGFTLHSSGVVLDGSDGSQALDGLSQLRMRGLRDGRLLVTGSGAGGGTARRAFVLSLTRPGVQAVSASRVPSALVELADGTVVELDEQRASLRRHDLRGAFDDAPDPIVGEGLEAVVLDLAERWQEGPEGLRALTAARLDLPHLRFAALGVEVELLGEAELLLEREGAPPFTIALGEERIALGSCELERAQGALRIERAGTELVLASGSRTKTCAAPALTGHVGVALRTLGPATIASLVVRRR